MPTRGKSSIPATAREAVCLVSACITLQGACCFPVHRPELFRWQVTYYIPSEKPGSRAQIGPTGSKITVTDTNHRDELLSLNLQGEVKASFVSFPDSEAQGEAPVFWLRRGTLLPQPPAPMLFCGGRAPEADEWLDHGSMDRAQAGTQHSCIRE